MSVQVNGDWIKQNGKRVDYIQSRFMSGTFAPAPSIAVMHFTGGGSARSSAEWFRDPSRPTASGSSAHCVIDRDGTIIQCVPLTRVAWHAGKSRWRDRTGRDLNGLNTFAYGIELANWGNLRRAGDGWATGNGAPIASPVLAVHRNGNPDGSRTPIGWEPYPAAQIDAAAALVQALVALGVTEIVGHDDIAPVRKSDPGPAFDMARFRARVLGGRADNGAPGMTVAIAAGLNLRAGPGTQFAAIELLAQGTRVEPIEQDGNWLQVSVLDAQGAPRATGWVRGSYLSDG